MSVQRALRNGLRRASDWGLASLALPPFGMAVGAADPEVAARVLVEILFNHLDEGAPPRELLAEANRIVQAHLESLRGDAE